MHWNRQNRQILSISNLRKKSAQINGAGLRKGFCYSLLDSCEVIRSLKVEKYVQAVFSISNSVTSVMYKNKSKQSRVFQQGGTVLYNCISNVYMST